MRNLLIAFFLALVSCSSSAVCDTKAPSVSQMSLADIDVRIKEVKVNIRIYQNRAVYADRQAQQLSTHDFFGYRQSLDERDQNLEAVKALQKELAILEQQRTTIVEGHSGQ
jgi:hypothetical protein